MSKKLIIFINEHWPHTPSTAWALVDDRDRVLEQGQSDARHWPAAGDCELVLAGPQCAWLRTLLPGNARGDLMRLLRYALEDQLIGDVDEQHFTVTGRNHTPAGVEVSVLVLARQRLRQLLAQMEALGRRPVRVVSALQTGAAAPDGRWHLLVEPDHGCILHRPGLPAMAMDGDSAAALIEHLVDTQIRTGGEPPGLNLHLSDGATAPDLSSLQSTNAMDLTQGPAHRWWADRRAAADLLHGDFSPGGGGSGLLRALRAPAALAALAALLLVGINTAEVVWQGQQLRDVEARMTRLFETTVPNTPAIAPAVQLRRSLDDARSHHGQLREDDFLSLLDALAEVGGAEIHGTVERVEYDSGTLRLDFIPESRVDTDLLRVRLATFGYSATPSPGNASTLELRRSPLQ